MTEEEWLTFKRPKDVMQSLFVRAMHAGRTNPAYPEKFRRFAVACCRRMGWLLASDDIRGLDLLDRYSETRSHDDLKAARKAFKSGSRAEGPWSGDRGDNRVDVTWYAREHAKYALDQCHKGKPGQAAHGAHHVAAKVVAALAALDTNNLDAFPFHDTPAPTPEEIAIQCATLRDIFGNPFRPVSFSSSWRTDTALALAQQMYESRDFGAMPILADALQDAGCESEDILSHCRDGNQVHVRGCWVVDLVLGKE